MSFDSGKLVSSATARIRLQIGDVSEDFPILDDSVYEYLLYKNNSDELRTAIEALENIINYYSLNPQDESFGTVSGAGYNPRQMEKRLEDLKGKLVTDSSNVKRVPVMIKTDRTSWNDFNKLFGDD